MNIKEYEIVAQVKAEISKVLQGVQYMKIEDGYIVYEAFGNTVGEYVNYVVDLNSVYVEDGYVEGFEVKRINVTVEKYSEAGEIDLTINTWSFDESMKETSFNDELVKTYKRLNPAIKKGKDVHAQIAGSNFSIIEGAE